MSTKLFAIGFCTLALFGGLAAWTQPQPPAKAEAKGEEADDEVEIKLSEAPEAVRKAAAKITPADKVKKVTKESDEGVVTFEIEYTQDGAECSAVLTAAGDVMEIEKALKEGDIPAPAMAALKKAHPGATFSNFVSVQKFAYEARATKDGKKHAVEFDAAGRIEGHEKDEHDEKDKD